MKPRHPVRILLYSHDSFGLGHLRRSLSIAAAIVERDPNASALLVTGSPTPALFDLPPRCEIVKLPCITKDFAGEYVARSLPVTSADVVSLRSSLITAAARAFRPHLVLVDHTATGPGGELLPVLRRFRHEAIRTRVVLGMRDLVDSPRRARQQLRRDGTIDWMRAGYDEILVYGDRDVFDVGEAYGLPADVRAKTEYVGFVCPPSRPHGPTERNGITVPRLLASAGGGEDGYDLLRGAIAAFRGPLRGKPLRATLVTGPLMSDDELRALRAARQDDPRIEIIRATRKMPSLIRRADLLIGMGGYNSVYESLRSGKPLLVMPRTHPREEQLERCTRLGRAGHLSVLTREDVTSPPVLAGAILDTLASAGESTAPPLPFDGAAATADRLITAVREPASDELPAAAATAAEFPPCA